MNYECAVRCEACSAKMTGFSTVSEEAAFEAAFHAVLNEGWSLEDRTGWGFPALWYCPAHQGMAREIERLREELLPKA